MPDADSRRSLVSPSGGTLRSDVDQAAAVTGGYDDDNENAQNEEKEEAEGKDDEADYDKLDYVYDDDDDGESRQLTDADLHAEDIPADKNAEYYEFKLSRSERLRCERTSASASGSGEGDGGGSAAMSAAGLAACGACEACRLLAAARDARQWFWRCGHSTQWRFLLGLLQRSRGTDLLRYVVHLTATPDGCKDRTYARSRGRPGMFTDRASGAALAVAEGSASGDRALQARVVERRLAEAWAWFDEAAYWTKANYMLALLRSCDAELLSLICRQAQTLLAVETRVAAYKETLPSSRASSAVTARTQSARSSGNDRSRLDESDATANAPELLVMSNASKAYSGMARYKDFIRELPVHLSKYILGMLDEATLQNCHGVSLAWRHLVDETKKEFFTNQQKQEDIMLLQGSSGVNPNYANDISVPVPNVCGDTGEVVLTDEAVMETRFHSEISMASAYSGVSTRKVIMEERNVYCGSYNVLVLVTEPYTQRTMHTSGGKYVAVDSTDRRVHLIDVATASESLPPIAGHAGPVRAIHIDEAEGFVLTGSFDTSIRKWELKTRKCKRIFNGHQDTVVALDYCGKLQQFASASLDCSAKVWSINTGKCLRTFKHKHPVMCVALSEELCISGCQAGRVKVWNMETGKLIKLLLGHKAEITAVKFDKWHIVTASRDGYALAWSSQGQHNKCVMALRHPCEVTSIEFMYLRVITGAEDGRVRIWNIITGQCCRIMRGNSQSDPIISLTAVGDSLTVNTRTNVLMLSFEPVEWDYSLNTDKMKPLVSSAGAFGRSPLRPRPYAYARAHRSEQADCADRRLLESPSSAADSAGGPSTSQSRLRSVFWRRGERARSAAAAATIDAKRRCRRRLRRAVTASSSRTFFSGSESDSSEGAGNDDECESADDSGKGDGRLSPTLTGGSGSRRGRATRIRTAAAAAAATAVSTALSPQSRRRRVSWASQGADRGTFFDDSPLEDVKAMLKRQIRGGDQRTTAVPSARFADCAPAVSSAVVAGVAKEVASSSRPLGRPHSSPPKVDSQVKVKVSKEQWAELLGDDPYGDNLHDTERGAGGVGRLTATTAARAYAKRPCSAPPPPQQQQPPPMGVAIARRPPGEIARNRSRPLSTTATEICEVPMLMYPKSSAVKRATDDSRGGGGAETQGPAAAAAAGRLAAVPAAYTLCSFTPLRLKTYSQEQATALVNAAAGASAMTPGRRNATTSRSLLLHVGEVAAR